MGKVTYISRIAKRIKQRIYSKDEKNQFHNNQTRITIQVNMNSTTLYLFLVFQSPLKDNNPFCNYTPQLHPPLTHPHTQLHLYCVPPYPNTNRQDMFFNITKQPSPPQKRINHTTRIKQLLPEQNHTFSPSYFHKLPKTITTENTIIKIKHNIITPKIKTTTILIYKKNNLSQTQTQLLLHNKNYIYICIKIHLKTTHYLHTPDTQTSLHKHPCIEKRDSCAPTNLTR